MKFYSLIPPFLIFLSAVLLIFSGLSYEKAILLESELFSKFLRDLTKQNFFYALTEFLKSILNEIIIPLAPFLILCSLGFSLIILLKDLDFKILLLFQTILFGIFLLIHLSITSLFLYIGIIISTLSVRNLKKEISFSSGSEIVSKSLRWVSIFLCIGFFLNLQLNFDNYYATIYESNINFVKSFLPDINELIEARAIEASRFINQTTDGIKNALSEAYNKLDVRQKENCGYLFQGLTEALENYKTEANKKVYEEWREEDVERYVEEIIPFKELIKITPLLLTLLLFTLLEIIRPFLSLIFGIAFSLTQKFKA